MTDMANKIAVVTGGASGIGLALAQAYGLQGATVLIADIDEYTLSDARKRLQAAGINAAACFA
jgi:NAD(P)-dependent dehydrogenase (short-subunit alcohol dehydrogenase family)